MGNLLEISQRYNDKTVMDIRCVGCDEVNCKGLVQNHMQWLILVVKVLNLRFFYQRTNKLIKY
jgi:hypothetical protein